ncbi:MAG TPA: YkvA family protein [Blastocatellia bacterium]|nr:YkvA family protein [Blastocatellia bacterium]
MLKRRRLRGAMRELLLFIPNLVRLLVDLLRDPRVSTADKAILAGTIIYVIAPIDVIPDFIPFIGQVDDVYLLGISIMRLLNRSERRVVLEHWRGNFDIKELVSNITNIAEYFLPKRLKNVLRGKIEPRTRLSAVPEPHAVNE